MIEAIDLALISGGLVIFLSVRSDSAVVRKELAILQLVFVCPVDPVSNR